MTLPQSIASVNVGGTHVPLSKGMTTLGSLKFDLVLEHKAKNLYSWVVYLENDSDQPSPRIREFLGLDMLLPVRGAVRLNTLRGDDCTIYSFYPEEFTLAEGETVTRSPTGARSSSVTAFPYFDIADEKGNGIVCGIGWSGQWRLQASRTGDEVRLTAGFEDCDFYLEPHEKVRSVRILLYTGTGGADKLRHRFVRLHRK